MGGNADVSIREAACGIPRGPGSSIAVVPRLPQCARRALGLLAPIGDSRHGSVVPPRVRMNEVKTMKKTLLIGIAALLVLLCFGGVSAEKVAELAVYQLSSPDMTDITDAEVLSGEAGVQDVKSFSFESEITESLPSRTFQFTVPSGVYNSIQVDMKFYQVDGEWSDLRLKLVDSNNRVLAQDDGSWLPFTENGERHVQYDQRLQEGDIYRVVVEKVSLVGDTEFDGTIKLQT